MYEDYYGLSACPFRLTPDRRFYFGSEGHRKAMSYLKFGLYQGEGFIVITGDVGTGKSTLVSQLFTELDSNQIVAAQIGTTQIDADDAIRLICSAFNIGSEVTGKAALLAEFEKFLVEQNQRNRRVLLVVDEAQNLPMRTLEELRMLSNFNISGQPLFQSFLVGQPQFLGTLSHPDLTQLQQRVIASYKLEAMSQDETREYILHRLQMVEWDGTPEFTEDSFDVIFRETQGVPRRINTLANRVMLYSALEELEQIDGDVIEEVIKDLSKEVIKNTGSQDLTAGLPPRPMSGDPDDNRPAAESIAARQTTAENHGSPHVLSADYAPHMGAEVTESLRTLSHRVERIEETLTEHEKALRELIDIAVNLLSAQDQSAE